MIGCSQLVRAMLPLHMAAMMSADDWRSVPLAVPSSRAGIDCGNSEPSARATAILRVKRPRSAVKFRAAGRLLRVTTGSNGLGGLSDCAGRGVAGAGVREPCRAWAEWVEEVPGRNEAFTDQDAMLVQLREGLQGRVGR